MAVVEVVINLYVVLVRIQRRSSSPRIARRIKSVTGPKVVGRGHDG
jgi:hypothetical protein